MPNPTLQNLVDAYVSCGKSAGYFIAEMTLMDFLPKSKPDGKCYNVPVTKRAACIKALEEAARQE